MNEDKPRKSRSRELPATIPPACRAKVMNAPDLVDCLTEDAHYCKDRLHFGTRLYCTHPQRLEIAARTAAEKHGKKP